MNRDVLNYRYALDAVFGRLNDLGNTGKDIIKDAIYTPFIPHPVTSDEIIARYKRLSTIEIKDNKLSERERECVVHFLAGKGQDGRDSAIVRLAIKMVRDHIARTGDDDPLSFFLLCDPKLKLRYEGRCKEASAKYDYYILGTGEVRYRDARYYKAIYNSLPVSGDNFLYFLYGYGTVTYTDYRRMRSIMAQTLAKDEYAHIIRYL